MRFLPRSLRFRRRDPSRQSEQGSAIVIIAISTLVLVSVAAISVDVASWFERSRQLQVAADAASLAGVAKLVDNGDQSAAQIEARRALAANGIDPNNTQLDITIDTSGGNQVNVTVKDKAVQLFFGGLITNNVNISRVSKAELDMCVSTCHQTSSLPQPNLELAATGTGDGFIPIVVDGSKMYAINHKTGPGTKALTCVDRFTNQTCTSFPREIGRAHV